MTWSAFSRFSPSREIAEAVKETLRGSDELRGWTSTDGGGPRIYYGVAIPDAPLPMIVVMMGAEGDEAQPSASELEVQQRVVVVFCFDEDRDTIDSGDHDFSSVLLATDNALWSNDRLAVDGREHALRLERAEDFIYEQITDAAGADGEPAGTVYPAREYTYVYKRNAATGIRTGPL